MKKVQIKQLTPLKSRYKYRNVAKYRIYLAPEFYFDLNSKHEAGKMLTKVNEFLTNKLYELNEVYINAFVCYRRLWFNMDSERSHGDMYQQNKSIREHFEDISKHFERAVSLPSTENQGAFVLLAIRNIMHLLTELIARLIQQEKRLRNYQSVRTLEIALIHLNRIDYTIKSYPKNHDKSNDIKGYDLRNDPIMKVV